MFKRIVLLLSFSFLFSHPSFAALKSQFDIIDFKPATDNSNYFTVYGSQTLKAWQGTLGFYFDYANRPLQFIATGSATGRQSVVDQLFVGNMVGAIGFTDWFEAGIDIPVVFYNDFFKDDASAAADPGGGMGDLIVDLKFRIVNIEKHKIGFSILPFFTLPSGDTTRFTGNGGVTGGMLLITDFQLHPRFSISLDLGGTVRDSITRNAVRMDDEFNYGGGANFKVTKNFELIGELFGTTPIRDFFQFNNSSPMEAGGGIRYYFGDSGFLVDLGANGGVFDGVGAPRYRGYAGLKWVSPISAECPACPPPAPPPDPRIQGGKIVLWGKIYYDTDKSTIKPISYPVLDDVVDVMQKNPQLKLVEVQGHCDIRGGDAYNMKLSQARAKSAMDYLISKGIDASRLTPKGYGWHQPVADNKTKEGMSQNRRTEFVILQQE